MGSNDFNFYMQLLHFQKRRVFLSAALDFHTILDRQFYTVLLNERNVGSHNSSIFPLYNNVNFIIFEEKIQKYSMNHIIGTHRLFELCRIQNKLINCM